MASHSGDGRPTLTLVASVRCLECGAAYAKPTGGGTVRQNPGCPECGYVGWMALDQPADETCRPSEFVADPLRRTTG